MCVWCVCDDGIAPDDIIIRVAAFIRFSFLVLVHFVRKCPYYTVGEDAKSGRTSVQTGRHFISLFISLLVSSSSWCRQKQKDPITVLLDDDEREYDKTPKTLLGKAASTTTTTCVSCN
jgi:hypothetical protein